MNTRRAFLGGTLGAAGMALLSRSALLRAQERPRPEGLEGFRLSTPEAEGFDSARLAAMTRYIEDSGNRVFSMMIARNGSIVYEMLAGGLSRDASHYLMSVTKSVTSALIGVALEKGFIASEDQPIGELLPPELFGKPDNLRGNAGITVRQILNMSALDVAHIVGNVDAATRDTYSEWLKAENRLRYVLALPRVQTPLSTMRYTDLTCTLANGVIHYRTGKTVLEFANEHLFSKMGFRNQEWMGQDAAGIDLGGYGMRLRPIDMLKFGQLYLQRGVWEGKALLRPEWIDKAYASQIAPRTDLRSFYTGYGNYWWHGRHRGAPRNLMANGWKGQRISVFPSENLVVTLTGVIERAEGGFYEELISRHVLYALRGEPLKENVEAFGQLRSALARMRERPLDLQLVEARMRPEEKNKQKRRPWSGR